MGQLVIQARLLGWPKLMGLLLIICLPELSLMISRGAGSIR
jgi:hypothetical protein